MELEHLDALIVCGNQYAGFEGATFYVSGFEIVHRYVYVVLPLEGEPTLVFPREARWIGDKKNGRADITLVDRFETHLWKPLLQTRGRFDLGVFV